MFTKRMQPWYSWFIKDASHGPRSPFRSIRETTWTYTDQVVSEIIYRAREHLSGSVDWWAWIDSNYRPPLYQSGALTG